MRHDYERAVHQWAWVDRLILCLLFLFLVIAAFYCGQQFGQQFGSYVERVEAATIGVGEWKVDRVTGAVKWEWVKLR